MSSLHEFESYSRLKDKIVLITGASAGIGEACAYGFAANGSNLILGARRVDKLNLLKEKLIEKYGVCVHVGYLDVSKGESVTEFITNIPDELFQQIDILVNNAGLAIGKDLTHEVLNDDISTMVDVNVKGLLYVTKAIVPGMIERQRGHIINIGSVAGLEAYVGGSVYCATKHAVQAITVSLRKELVGKPIRVSIISPGLVETEFSVIRFKGDQEKADSVYKGMTPLTGNDIADNVLYAASRPPHVQIAELLVFPSCQASSEIVFRK